jgi:hypothetical protein
MELCVTLDLVEVSERNLTLQTSYKPCTYLNKGGGKEIR